MSAIDSDSSEWHSNQRDYDEYLTPSIDSRAELYGYLRRLCEEYEHVVVVSKFRKHGRNHNREVDPDALSYDRERNTLDIYGKPATGRFPRPNTFKGIKVWNKC